MERDDEEEERKERQGVGNEERCGSEEEWKKEEWQ